MSKSVTYNHERMRDRERDRNRENLFSSKGRLRNEMYNTMHLLSKACSLAS